MKYTRDKVLYFASREESVNIRPNEPQGSDLRNIILGLLKSGLIAETDYYQCTVTYNTTKAGMTKHLENQIKWRKERNMDYSNQQRELQLLEGT